MHKKKWFLGVDEAGYGPNLGPLVVAATVWEVPLEFSELQLGEYIKGQFECRPWNAGCQHIPLGDSKQLYQPSSGLMSLESGLLAILDHLYTSSSGVRDSKSNLSGFIQRLAAAESFDPRQPWYSNLHEFPVPCQQTLAELKRLSLSARRWLERRQIKLVKASFQLITESCFNAQVAQLGSKGQLLSRVTLGLIAELLRDAPIPAEIFCDRHGGRKNYLPLLCDTWPDDWFTQTLASPMRSTYEGSLEPRRRIHFTVRGDSFPPTAVASMLAKYVRERMMESLNAFWLRHVPDLRPTAGYPVDARRFRDSISATADRLGLSKDEWWRSR